MNNIVNTPSKSKYIGVWFLNSILCSITVFIIDTGLVEILFNNIDDINDYYFGVFICVIVETAFVLLISFFIYGYFNDLKISKVMPYIYIFWTLGMFQAYSSYEIEFRDTDISITYIGWTYFAALLIAVFGFRFYFINKDNWK